MLYLSDHLMPVAWEVQLINQSEITIARCSLFTQFADHEHGYLLGDGLYDVNALYDQAAEKGLQLIAPRKRKAKGLGHHRHSPFRLKGLSILLSDEGCKLLKAHKQMEREFSQLIGFGGGLTCLPTWVRRLHRVRMWVWGSC